MRHGLSVLLFILMFAAAGCSIHEVPEGGDENAGVVLSLDIFLDDEISQYASIAYSTKAAGPQARYIVRFFPIVGEKVVTEAPFEFVATEDALTDRTYALGVPPLNYHLEVWADWTAGDAPFYNAADFGAVAVNLKPYIGAVASKDAFCGSMDLDLSGYPANNSIATASITLSRPVARYNFISTDKDEFLNYWAGEIAASDGTNVKDPDAVDLSGIRVVVTYPQYMPSVYDLHQGLVTDSATGVSFETHLKVLPDGNLEVAWDWVLASGEDPSVVVSLAFYDYDGTFINKIDDVQIPLSPGLNTTVTGKLLTSDFSSGIRIDPSFDGEFIIHI